MLSDGVLILRKVRDQALNAKSQGQGHWQGLPGMFERSKVIFGQTDLISNVPFPKERRCAFARSC